VPRDRRRRQGASDRSQDRQDPHRSPAAGRREGSWSPAGPHAPRLPLSGGERNGIGTPTTNGNTRG
jgi:hypothetical protein